MTNPVGIGPVVVKIGGVALEDQRGNADIWTAIANRHRNSPEGVILVHGGGRSVDRHLERLGMTTERRDGIRITPPEQAAEIAAVLAGKVNKSLVGVINAHGGNAVGLCLSDGHSLRTAKATRYPFDAGRVGEVTGGNGMLFRVLLREGYMPVVSSIGLDAQGEFLNINADDAAAALAAAVAASSLVLLTDVPGVLDGRGNLVREATRGRLEAMIASGEIRGGMMVKVRAACDTAEATGSPVTILNGNDPASVGAWARGEPIGTTIRAHETGNG